MDVKCNVGMLVHGYYPRDVRVRREAEALVEAGYRVEVVCLREPKQPGKQRETLKDCVNGVSIQRLPISRRRGNLFCYIFEYLGLIILGGWKLTVNHLKRPYRVVHVHNMPDILVVTGLIPKWMGAKLLLDVHDPMSELYVAKTRLRRSDWISKALKYEEKISYKLAHCIVSVNETMREILEEKGVQAKKILITHNFPYTKYFPLKCDEIRWPRNKENFILLYAGTITRQYRLDIAIQTLVLIRNYLPKIKLRIFGDGNELGLILKLAKKLGVDDCMEYSSPVAPDKLLEMMSESDAGISCHQGGLFGDLQLPGKIFEYLTQGLPVIASRTKTLARYIPEDCVFYFDPENIEDMANQIIKMWREPELVKRKIENAKKLFPQYTWEKEKHKLISFYQGFIN